MPATTAEPEPVAAGISDPFAELGVVAVVLELRPDPPGPDAAGVEALQRLRRLLKGALREHGWRCTKIRPIVERRPKPAEVRA